MVSFPTGSRIDLYWRLWPSLGVGQALSLIHCSDLEDMLTDDWSWLRGEHTLQAGAT